MGTSFNQSKQPYSLPMVKDIVGKMLQVNENQIHELKSEDVVFTSQCLAILNSKLVEFITTASNSMQPTTIDAKNLVSNHILWVEGHNNIYVCISSENESDIVEIPNDSYKLVKNGTIH